MSLILLYLLIITFVLCAYIVNVKLHKNYLSELVNLQKKISNENVSATGRLNYGLLIKTLWGSQEIFLKHKDYRYYYLSIIGSFSFVVLMLIIIFKIVLYFVFPK